MARFAQQKPFSMLAAVLAVSFSWVAATAQEQTAPPAETSGRSVLLEAVKAAKELGSFRADVALSGAGDWANFVPTGVGTLRATRQEEAVEGRTWHTRIDASYTAREGADEEEITVLRTPEALVWADHKNQKVEERTPGDSRVRIASAIELLTLPEVTTPEPYERELREATSWRELPQEEINGTLCDVVEIEYDMSTRPEGRIASVRRTPSARWYFGAEDRLPRRVERITDQEMISFIIVLDLENVETDLGIEPSALAIETPAGYERVDRRPGSTPVTDAPRDRPSKDRGEQTPEKEEETFRHADLPAHGFELVDAEGNEVTLESLKGNVAVLYFWGTWCIPCREYSPLVSELAETFEDEPVKVFGLPVRERSEERVREAMGDYAHTLLLSPEQTRVGADVVARAYKVRIYPTIYVIGFDSEVLAVRWPDDRDTPTDELAARQLGEIETLIRNYLDERE